MNRFFRIVSFGMIFIFLALIIFVYSIGNWQVSDSIALPALAIIGLMLLLASLALMAVTFSYMGISDKTQALALPEGSVRAVIALCLLVLFAILSIYLYGHLATPTPIQAFAGLTGADKDNLIKTFSTGDLVSITGSEAEKFTVYVRQSVSPESVDFAKQILVMLGTLVASISSFYFGSRTAESAGSKGDSPGPSLSDPTINSVSPSATVRSSVAKSILIIGQNLGGIQSVSLSNGASVVHATGVTATSTGVICDVKLGADVAAGVWSVNLTYGSGKTVTAGQSIAVS